MTSFRQFLLRHHTLAAWLLVAALLMKILVPGGFMPVVSGGSITIELCSGFGPEKMTMAMPGMAGHGGKHDQSGKGDMPCGFGGHASPAFSMVDPTLLTVAIIYVITTVFRIAVVRVAKAPAFLRPQLRGPPVLA